MPKMNIDDLRSMRPERPAELDRLSAFVGRWKWEGRATLAGMERPLRVTGSRDTTLEGNGWYLVSREAGEMEGLGQSQGMSVWTYDPRGKVFRTYWVDSMGTTTAGKARYNKRTATWHLQATSRTPSGTARAEGHVRFPDQNTMEWDWTEYAGDGRSTTIEMQGVCKRVP